MARINTSSWQQITLTDFDLLSTKQRRTVDVGQHIDAWGTKTSLLL